MNRTFSARSNVSEPAPMWMINTDLSGDDEYGDDANFSPMRSTGGLSSATGSSFKSKYEPLRSVHADIQDVFLRPHRNLKSRGHEIPEPRFRNSSTGGEHSFGGRAVSRGSKSFDRKSQNNANVQSRPHTSGTMLPHTFSPIRPTERGKLLFSRASSPVMLRHGRVISRDIFGKKYPYPLNNISYERPSAMTHDVLNSSVPDGADSILEDNRFTSIAPFIKKEFYDSMSAAQMKELAEKRKRKKIVTKTFPDIPPMMSIDYEKRGSPGAVKRQVHRQLFG